MPTPSEPAATGVESNPPESAMAAEGRRVALGRHVTFTQVELVDGTDRRSELVHERHWLLHPNEALELRGNLFVAHDHEAGGGKIFVKLAPLPDARPEPIDVDLAVPRKKPDGFHAEFKADERYAWAVIDYVGGAFERAAALQRWQRERAGAIPGSFITNTWGDRSRDGRITHDFLLAEVDAAARLKADLLQIDDGWQRGRTSNSVDAASAGGVWEGFHDKLPDFWTPDPDRLPQGLEPIVEAARSRGLGLGLWYAPDSSNDFAHWARDVETLVGLHCRYGVASFKLDSIDIRSAEGEARVGKMIDAVHEQTGGAVTFDLDITAGRRLGYYGKLDAGPLFVQNRYTDWGTYWPHQTLRALWSLSGWVDPARLRFELLNPERNGERYGDSPLAPGCYSPDALFAMVMFGLPLGWFECSGLGEAAVEAIGGLAAKWREHRGAIHGGTIVGIGDAPDGFGWTGLASVAADRRSAQVVAFRGLKGEAETTLAMPGGLRVVKGEVIAGEGALGASGQVGLGVGVAEPLGYVWGRVTLSG